MNLISDKDLTKLAVRSLQDASHPLKLVINPSWGGSLGLRHQCEIFYLNFPKIITINKDNQIKNETEVNSDNFHLIHTELKDLIKIIKSERRRALKHYASVIFKFFYRSKK